MKRYIIFATLLPLIVLHHMHTKDTCLIETRKLAKSCPENFEFIHNGKCHAVSWWPDWDKEFFCESNSEETCVRYEISEFWNAKNELVKKRSPHYVSVKMRVYVELSLSKNGELGDVLFAVCTVIYACFVVGFICVNPVAAYAFAFVFVPGSFLRQLYMWSFPLCLSSQ